jgi:phosphotransferase system HPr (HPr) family protein
MEQETQNESVERQVEIRNKEGLHMRPAMQFVDCANGFESAISVCKDDECVDGKSIMQMTMLAAGEGTRLKLIATGRDASEAIDALAHIIELPELPETTDK